VDCLNAHHCRTARVTLAMETDLGRPPDLSVLIAPSLDAFIARTGGGHGLSGCCAWRNNSRRRPRGWQIHRDG